MFGRSLPPRRTLEPDPSMAGLQSDLSFCTVRAAPGDTLDTVTIYLSLYIPTVLGPVLTLLLCLLSLPFSSSCLPASSSCCSSLLLPCLILLHISNYYINLFLADTQHSDFHFLLVKYGAGFSFIILSPLLIIAAENDIRLGVKKTLKSSVLCAMSKVVGTEQNSSNNGNCQSVDN